MARGASGSHQKVTWAASLGDRSENADYQYNKKRLREIDRRVRYLRKCMSILKIVDYAPQQNGKVFFGAGSRWKTSGAISSAFASSAMMKSLAVTTISPLTRRWPRAAEKEVGDAATVATPQGDAEWYVNAINYVTS